MPVDMDTIDISLLKRDGDILLLETQKQYEEIIKALGETRDNYADAIVDFENGKAQKIKELLDLYPKMQITVAKELAREACKEHFARMTHLEQMKKRLQGYQEAVKERLQTFKIILKIRYSDLEGV